MKKLCPECDSELISYNKKRNVHTCWACNSTFETPIEKDGWSRAQLVILATLIMTAITVFLAAILYTSVVAMKPAIYIYTPKQEKESLKLKVKGKITTRIPHREGIMSLVWENLTLKDGKILDNGKKFDYLFYESENIPPKHDNTGWALKRQDGNLFWNNEPINQDELPGIFTEILSKYGLFDNEIADFNEYWFGQDMKLFFGRESFNFGIFPISLEELDRIFSIETELDYPEYVRVQFLMKEIDENQVLAEPPYPEIKRSEYVLHEWGIIKG